MQKANGHALKYNNFYTEGSSNKHSLDFILDDRNKIMPIEVKSSNYKSHASVDAFARKYHQYVSKKIIIYSKNYWEEDDCVFLPVYMTMCL